MCKYTLVAESKATELMLWHFQIAIDIQIAILNLYGPDNLLKKNYCKNSLSSKKIQIFKFWSIKFKQLI